MRRFFVGLIVALVSAYVLLHVVLGSTPVQRRIISEMQMQLKALGLDLKIESIEFSALFPRIYLNRVTVLADDKGKFQGLPQITIDKIKFEFQPLALLVREIQVTELSFFHPVFVAHNVERWIPLFQKEFGGSKKKTVTTPIPFRINFKKVGFVDALMDLKSTAPLWTFTSPSLTFFIQNGSKSQMTVQAEIRNGKGRYETTEIDIKRFDLDADWSEKSVRLNRLQLDGEKFSLTTTGVSSLDAITKQKIPSSSALAIDYDGDISWLNRLGILGEIPELAGNVGLHLKAKTNEKTISTTGALKYKNVYVDGYRIGSGDFLFESDPKNWLHLKDLSFLWAGGELSSRDLAVSLSPPYPIQGKMKAKGLSLKNLLSDVRTADAPVNMNFDGELNVTGAFSGPFQIAVDVQNPFTGLVVESNDPKEPIIEAGAGKVQGQITFFLDRMTFDTAVDVLGGRADVKGHLGFNSSAELSVKAKNISLTELKHISNLNLKGTVAQLEAEISASKALGGKINGAFTTNDSEIEGVRLGEIQGRAHFESGLLTFEDLVLASDEPILGRGYVDFSPEKTHYKFQADVKRTELARVFQVFPEGVLPFPEPTGGELSGRVFIEGGRDNEGLEIEATGQAKDFDWYGEHWQGGSFSTNFRPKHTSLRRILLFKRTGALQVSGSLDDGETELHFKSHSLRLEEFAKFKGTSLSGELLGDVEFKLKEGKLTQALGKIQAKKFTFRSAEIPEWSLNMQSDETQVRSTFAANDGSFAGTYRHPIKKGEGELSMSLVRFDGLPWLSALLGMDLDTFQEVRLGGRIDLVGSLERWNSLRGRAKLDTLRLGLRNAVLESRKPIEISMEPGEFKIAPFLLEGGDSQFSGDWHWSTGGKWQGRLDGRSDVGALRPFLPFVESASGRLAFGVRATGSSARRDFLGNARIEQGALRFKGMTDEIKGIDAQLTLSSNAIRFDKFDANVNGGVLKAGGEIGMDLFTKFVPRLTINTDRVMLHFMDNNLETLVSGDFTFAGKGLPYHIAGKCQLIEANLLKLESAAPLAQPRNLTPTFTLDVDCNSRGAAHVKTDLLNAQFKGNFHLVGKDTAMGLLGQAELIDGKLLFRETPFTLNSGVVKFESESRILPRFNLSGTTRKKEEKGQNPAEYEVTLLAYGIPEDYRIRLTSSPALSEPEIISLLLLGFTGRGSEGNFMDLGSAVMGQIPLQSKIQGNLGFDIKIKSKNQAQSTSISSAAGSNDNANPTVPSVVIQKDITRKTRLSYSSTLDTASVKEFRVEQLLNDNLSINATTTDRTKSSSATTSSTSSQSYGLDVRYRFTFE